MKKIAVLFLMMVPVLLGFAGCSNNNNGGNIQLTSKDVIGKWSIDAFRASDSTSYIPIVEKDSVSFSPQGTYTVNFLGNSYQGTYYAIKGNTVTGVTANSVTEYYVFTSLVAKNAVVWYMNTTGSDLFLKATKE